MVDFIMDFMGLFSLHNKIHPTSFIISSFPNLFWSYLFFIGILLEI